jgi:TolB-like protein/Flp pilus assembly protein TadD
MAWLNDHDVHLWYDEGISAGEIWRGELATAIEGASALICFLSPSSVASPHCLREIHYALDRNLKIVPVYLEDTDLPSDLRIGLTSIQALELDDRDYHVHLLRALGSSAATDERPVRRGEKPRRRSLRSAALAIVLFALVGGGTWWFSARQIDSNTQLASIAVMPFDDRSPGGGEEWLGHALAETLTDHLWRVDGLRVPGSMSTASLKKRGASIQEVGEELDVGAVVEGTVQRAGDGLQVSVRWVQIDDEFVLWSAIYPSNFDNIIETQRVIAMDVAEAIRTTLGIRDTPEFFAEERYATSDVRAWKAVRGAIDLVVNATVESRRERFREAEKLARQAIDFDPEFAEAHGALALITSVTGNHETAAAAKRRALELDPHNMVAHATFIPYNRARWDYATATEQFEQARRGTSGTNSQISAMFGFQRVLWIGNRKQEALEYAKRAAELEPLFGLAHYNLGLSYLVLDDPDFASAIGPLEQARRLGAMEGFVDSFLAIAYASTGREADARDAYLRLLGGRQELSTEQRDLYLQAFESDGWTGMLRAVLDDNAERGNDMCSGFPVHAMLGDRESMYRCLDRIWSGSEDDWPRRDFGPLFNVLLQPAYAPYRVEPRFKSLIERVRARIEQAAGTGDQFGGVPAPV